jgi:hypothetical protein
MHLLNHMQQRDPSGQRPKAMLVDGETKQLGALKTEGKKLGMTMQIVLDRDRSGRPDGEGLRS